MLSKQAVCVGPYEYHGGIYARWSLGYKECYMISNGRDVWPFRYGVGRFEIPINTWPMKVGYYGQVMFFTLWGAKRYMDKRLREHGVKILTKDQFDALKVLI